MPIDERAFINKKRANWERLSLIVERAKHAGLKSLTRDEIPALGSLYRRAAADLAYARQQEANPNLVLYLNELVGNAHGVIYTEPSSGWAGTVSFLRYDLPYTLRRRMAFVVAAVLFSVLGAVIAYELCRANPANLSLFIPEQFQDVFKEWKQGFADHGDVTPDVGLAFSGYLMTHNTQVGIVAFATGITLVAPIYLMLQNGFIMGALIAAVQPTGHLSSMWAGILPHGACELSAIFICGGAGLCIAWGFIAPGRRPRTDSLVEAGKDAVKMMIGAVPLFVIAGFFEGNVSHSSIPHWAKFSLAAVQFALLLTYIYASPPPPDLKERESAATR